MALGTSRMPNSSSNTVVVVLLRARRRHGSININNTCDSWEGLEEKSIVNCAGVVLFGWI